MFNWFTDEKRQKLEREAMKATLNLKLMLSGTDKKNLVQKVNDHLACQALLDMMKNDKKLVIECLKENGIDDETILDSINELNSHLNVAYLLHALRDESKETGTKSIYEQEGLTLEYIPAKWEGAEFKPEHIRYSKEIDFDKVLDKMLKNS